MEKFFRIVFGLILCIGLPVGCSYELYQDSRQFAGGVPAVILMVVFAIVVWGYIIYRWLKK